MPSPLGCRAKRKGTWEGQRNGKGPVAMVQAFVLILGVMGGIGHDQTKRGEMQAAW